MRRDYEGSNKDSGYRMSGCNLIGQTDEARHVALCAAQAIAFAGYCGLSAKKA